MKSMTIRKPAAAAIAAVLMLGACATVPPPAPVPAPAPAPAPVIIIQPVKPEPPPVIVQQAPEPTVKINEEAEEALAILNDLQKLVVASADEQKRELTAASQAVSRQRSDVARLTLGMLQSLPANGSDEVRAMSTLEPLLRVNGPVRAAAIVILAQLGERQRSLREEKKRAEDLQQKLDALKALERSLLGRERKPAP
jgi:hypothetical protein